MSFLRWIITAIVALLILGFTLSNLDRVDVNVTPFHDPYSLPLYFVILGSLVVGFLWGGILVWANAYPARKEGRKQRKTIERLEKELEEEREARLSQKTDNEHESLVDDRP